MKVKIVNKSSNPLPGYKTIGSSGMDLYSDIDENETIDLGIKLLIKKVYNQNVNAGWWTDINTGESLVGKRNIGELLCLVHSEISEAMEGYRKNLMDDKLQHRSMFEVELADAVIRIADICGSMEIDLAGAISEKMEYNKKREDHKIENRKKDNGKKF